MNSKKQTPEQYAKYVQERFPIKEEFRQRMQNLLGKEETETFFKISYTKTPNSIRCNTLKITPEDLLKRLKAYGWNIKQPFPSNPEIMTLEDEIKPGELGKTKEHLLGYYYVQEISSMLPILVLQPQSEELMLDLCASPGSKTTQAAAMMQNRGTIIANEINMGRVSILNANLERCGVMNAIVTRKDGVALCNTFLKKSKIRFDKILVDAPCSGEGTLRKSPKTFLMWNRHMINKIARTQKRLVDAAIQLLKVGGEMVYSTCTLAPEENEEIVNYLLTTYDIELESINLPLKFRKGVCEWEGKEYDDSIKKCLRLYPQDNNTDGFFVAKIKKLSNNVKVRDIKK